MTAHVLLPGESLVDGKVVKDLPEYKLGNTEDFEGLKENNMKVAEEIQAEKPFTQAKSIKEAEKYAKKNGVKYADYSKLPLETADEMV